MTEIIEQPQSQGVTETSATLSMIERVATNDTVPIDRLDKLLDMQERIMDRQARIDFDSAHSRLTAEIPKVPRNGKSHNGSYSTLDDINKYISPILSRHGFSVSFNVTQTDKMVRVTANLKHEGGHSESTSLTLPYDDSGRKSTIHQIGSSVSYGKRYTISALLNISTGDDDDGQAVAEAEAPKVTEAQKELMLNALGNATDEVRDKFMQHYGSVNDVPAHQFMKVLDRIKGNSETGGDDADS